MLMIIYVYLTLISAVLSVAIIVTNYAYCNLRITSKCRFYNISFHIQIVENLIFFLDRKLF